MKLGQTADLKNKAKGGGFSKLRLREGDNIHRILHGPIKRQMVYYPTLIEDRETGELKQRMKILFQQPGGTTPLGVLASLERKIRKERGEKDPRSSLDPTTKYLYLVMDRDAEDYPSVEIAEYPFKVYEKIIEFEEATSKKKPNRLMHGLIFMYDMIITKKVDPNRSRMTGTSYSVQVDPENPYSGRLPVSYLGKALEELPKLDPTKFFSEEEWEAIEDSDLDLEDEARADTLEEMEAKLGEFPIYLGAQDNGSYRFPSLDQFEAQLEKLGIDFLGADAMEEAPEPKRLEEGDEEEFGEDDEADIEEAEFEDIDESDEDESDEDDLDEVDDDVEESDEEDDVEESDEDDLDEVDESEEDEPEEDEDEVFGDELDEPEPPKKKSKRKSKKKSKKVKEEEAEEEPDEDDEEDEPEPPKKKSTKKKSSKKSSKKKSSKKSSKKNSTAETGSQPEW